VHCSSSSIIVARGSMFASSHSVTAGIDSQENDSQTYLNVSRHVRVVLTSERRRPSCVGVLQADSSQEY